MKGKNTWLETFVMTLKKEIRASRTKKWVAQEPECLVGIVSTVMLPSSGYLPYPSIPTSLKTTVTASRDLQNWNVSNFPF